MVGLTEEDARAGGLDVGVAEYDYGGDARAQISGDADGLLRIIYAQGSHRIVGLHVLVEGAADLMGEAALAVRLGLTTEDLAGAIHPHPTLTEAFGLAAFAARSSPLAAERWSRRPPQATCRPDRPYGQEVNWRRPLTPVGTRGAHSAMAVSTTAEN